MTAGAVHTFAACLLVACSAAPAGQGSVTILGTKVRVELALDPESRARGLSGHAPLVPGEGMYFRWSEPDFHAIWMKDMLFDIDIVWIRDGRIVDIRRRAPHVPEGPLPVYQPREAADAVLEVPAGTATLHGWSIGDSVVVEGLPRDGP